MKVKQPMETEKPKKNSAWPFFILALAIIVAATIGSRLLKYRQAESIGTPAPPVQIDQWITSPPPDLNGQVYVLEFWATWCPPCKQSIPHMIELTNKYKDKVSFVAISTDESPKPVKEMVQIKGINYYVGMNNSMAAKYSITGIPSAFVVGRDGRIAWSGHPMEPGFEHAIVSALNAPPTTLTPEREIK